MPNNAHPKARQSIAVILRMWIILENAVSQDPWENTVFPSGEGSGGMVDIETYRTVSPDRQGKSWTWSRAAFDHRSRARQCPVGLDDARSRRAVRS
ncbi:hypothetical protein NOCA2220105 [metagenome]|uniref:Uncharacterized protein n=1 Tax=metagenome TaxID=256318 RepID=A0A2P2BYW3_9ZZZZ